MTVRGAKECTTTDQTVLIKEDGPCRCNRQGREEAETTSKTLAVATSLLSVGALALASDGYITAANARFAALQSDRCWYWCIVGNRSSCAEPEREALYESDDADAGEGHVPSPEEAKKVGQLSTGLGPKVSIMGHTPVIWSWPTCPCGMLSFDYRPDLPQYSIAEIRINRWNDVINSVFVILVFRHSFGMADVNSGFDSFFRLIRIRLSTPMVNTSSAPVPSCSPHSPLPSLLA